MVRMAQVCVENTQLLNFRQCQFKAPVVNGFSIDLFKLYKKVGSMGGWRKVRQRKWPINNMLDICEQPMAGGDDILRHTGGHVRCRSPAQAHLYAVSVIELIQRVNVQSDTRT